MSFLDLFRKKKTVTIETLSEKAPRPDKELNIHEVSREKGNVYGMFQGKIINKQDIYEARYRKHVWTRAGIDKIAKVAKRQAWDIVPAKGYAIEKDEINQNPQRRQLINALNNPNGRESFNAMLWKTFARLRLFHESFWQIQYDNNNVWEAFWVIEGDIKYLIDEHGNFKDEKKAYEEKGRHGQLSNFAYWEVVDFVLPSVMGGVRGMSDLEALEISTKTDLYSAIWNKVFFENSTQKPGAWVLPQGLSDAEARRNRAEIESKMSRKEGFYKEPVVVEGDVDWKDFGVSQKDSEFLEGRGFARDEHLAILGVPGGRLGLTEKVNRSNMESQQDNFIMDEIIPLQEAVEERVNMFFKEILGINEWEFKFKQYKFRRIRESLQTINTLGKYEAIRKNEARNMVGLPPLTDEEGGDDLISVAGGEKSFFKGEEPTARPPGKEADKLGAEELEQEDTKKKEPKQSLKDVPREELEHVWKFARKEALELSVQMKRIEDKFNRKLKTLMDEGRDYRYLANTVLDESISFTLIKWAKKSFVQGAKEISLLGGEEVLGFVDEKLAKVNLAKPKIEFIYGEVPDEYWERIKDRQIALSTGTMEKIVNGSARNTQFLKKVLQEGWAQGLSYNELTDKLHSEVFAPWEQWKTRRIARTETTHHYNFGRIRGLEAGGYAHGNVSLGRNPCPVCIKKASGNPWQLKDLIAGYSGKNGAQWEHPNGDCSIYGVRVKGQALPQGESEKLYEGLPMENKLDEGKRYYLADKKKGLSPESFHKKTIEEWWDLDLNGSKSTREMYYEMKYGKQMFADINKNIRQASSSHGELAYRMNDLPKKAYNGNLFRGDRLNADLNALKVGDELNLGVGSYTESSDTARYFASVRGRFGEEPVPGIVTRIKNPKKATGFAQFGMESEEEVLVFGKKLKIIKVTETTPEEAMKILGTETNSPIVKIIDAEVVGTESLALTNKQMDAINSTFSVRMSNSNKIIKKKK